MRDYELTVVLNPTLTREETAACWERIKRLVEERDGPMSGEEQWGTRRLAYPIQKVGQIYTEGTYLLGRFQLDPARAGEIEERLRLMEEVLRFLLVKAEAPQKAAPEPTPSQPAEAPQTAAPEPTPSQPAEAEAGAAESPDLS